MELLSRAYQAAVRTINEAIPAWYSRGLPPRFAPEPRVGDIDELAGDLREPAQPEPDPSAVPVAAGPDTDPAEVLPDTPNQRGSDW